MDNVKYPETEISNSCGYTEQELDIVNHWFNLTIEDAVTEGCKLREVKSKSCVPYQECRLANKSRSPFIEELYRPKCKSQYQTHLRCKDNSQAYCIQSRSPCIKPKCVPRCPLRIAQLAVPLKRHCLETWRANWDVLPPFMVERLKQQVLDERPIAHIADAVNCFKKRKSSKDKTLKSTKKYIKSGRNNHARVEKNTEELRKLCAIFGKKIAQKLITPQNLKLNPELDKISKIVAEDIADMMKNERFKIENMNDKMRAEISEKIAVWMATIMEETSYKLLEEDLIDLEEEEGPVLDFLDAVFDHVMDICNPQYTDFEVNDVERGSRRSEENRDVNSTYSIENNEFHTIVSYDDDKVTTRDIENEIYKVIDAVIKGDKIEGAKPAFNLEKHELNNLVPVDVVNNNINLDKHELNSLVPIEVVNNTDDIGKQIDESHEFQDIFENTDPETTDVLETLAVEDFTVPSDNIALDHNHTDHIEGFIPDTKMNNLFESFTEDSQDDKDKKVKFLNKDIGVNRRLDDDGKPALNDEGINKVESEYTIIKSQKKVFQPANENLLSDADERWPEDLPSNALKPSASVIRSITSLGNIIENEERFSNTLTSEIEVNVKELDTKNTEEKYEKLIKEQSPGKTIVSDSQKADSGMAATSESSSQKVNLNDVMIKNLPMDATPVAYQRAINELSVLQEFSQKENLNDAMINGLPTNIIPVLGKQTFEVSNSQQHLQKSNMNDAITVSDIQETYQEVSSQKSSHRANVDNATPTLKGLSTHRITKNRNQRKNGEIPKFLQKDILDDKSYKTLPSESRPPKDHQRVNYEIRASQLLSQKGYLPGVTKDTTGKLPKTSTAISQKGVNIFTHENQKEIVDNKNESNLLNQNIKQKQKPFITPPKFRFEYRVDPRTAPSWFRNEGKGEPSENPINGVECMTKSSEAREHAIRVWCKDLDSMFSNMDLWNSWLETTCKNLVQRKHDDHISRLNTNDFKRKVAMKWLTLKKDIDKDAMLWTKLYEKAKKKLKTYKAKMVSTKYCMLCDCKTNFEKRKL